MALLLACCFTAVATSSASASYAPAAAPYAQPVNNLPLDPIFTNPTFLPNDPAPRPSGLTFPGEWTKAGNTVTKARMAGRWLPGLTALGNIGLGVTAFTTGWAIGSTYMAVVFPGVGTQLDNDASWTGTYKWQLAGLSAPYGSSYTLTSVGGAQGSPGAAHGNTYCWPSENYNNAHVNSAMHNFTPGTEISQGSAGSVCASAPYKMKILSPSEMLDRVRVEPSTAAAYGATTMQSSTGPYTQPSHTAADYTAARGVIGAPVASRDASGVFHDAAGNVLSTEQVLTQLDLNCRLDSSYCAGGANDPTLDGQALAAPHVTVPDCAGMTYTECATAFEIAGFTSTPSRVTLDFAGAVVTLPADAVVNTSPASGASVSPSTSVTITANPHPASMPLVIPAPLSTETATAYRTRLEALGVLGAVSIDVLDDAALDPAYGPDAVVRSNPRAGTRVLPGTAVVVVANPSSAPDPSPGIGPFVAPVVPALDLSPLSHAVGCNKFPFGIPCWTYATVSSWVTDPVAPEFCIPFPGVVGAAGHRHLGLVDPEPCIDMSIWDDGMPVIRAMLLLMSFIGLGWLFMRAALGFGGGGGDDD